MLFSEFYLLIEMFQTQEIGEPLCENRDVPFVLHEKCHNFAAKLRKNSCNMVIVLLKRCIFVRCNEVLETLLMIN